MSAQRRSSRQEIAPREAPAAREARAALAPDVPSGRDATSSTPARAPNGHGAWPAFPGVDNANRWCRPARLTHRRDIIAIGASLGGPTALGNLLSQLPADLAASVLIVQHEVPTARSALSEMLQSRSLLPVKVAEDGERLRVGQVYIARSDHHLLIGTDDRLIVTRGPRENRSRPSVNPLFRSVAVQRSSRAIGVILTGALDDGVAGLAAIKSCGGITVVQDPREAMAPDMPRHAIAEVQVDHVVRLEQMGPLLVGLLGHTVELVEPPKDLVVEAKLSEPTGSEASALDDIGDKIAMSCPECGGPIWKVGHGTQAVYRCHLGHAASARAMLSGTSAEIERSMWVAIRSLQERAMMLRNMSKDAGDRGRASSGSGFAEKADEAEKHAEQARQFLLRWASLDDHDDEREVDVGTE